MVVRGIWEVGGPPQALLGNSPEYPALELRSESSSQISHSNSVYSKYRSDIWQFSNARAELIYSTAFVFEMSITCLNNCTARVTINDHFSS